MSTGTFNHILETIATETRTPIAAIPSQDRAGHEARMMVAWLAMRLIPGWSHVRIGLGLNCGHAVMNTLVREANSRRRYDIEWREKINGLLKRLHGELHRQALEDQPRLPLDLPSQPKPSPTGRDAPPISESDNWGFSGNYGGRVYLIQQNEAFAKKMIQEGYKRTQTETAGAE